MKRVLVVDNYDSFTFNLVQYLGELETEVEVWRNDRFGLSDVEKLAPDAVVVSPGPCTPSEAGNSVELIRQYGSQLPILGVCLGHQSIASAYGGRVVRATGVMHGKVSAICHNSTGVFRGLPAPFEATRYHSLIVRDLPEELEVNAWVDEGDERVVMGVRHLTHPVWGVQFHPESILTQHGFDMLRNFLDVA